MDGRHWMHDDGAALDEERESESKEKTHSSLIQTGEGFLLKFELCLGLSWLTLPGLVLGSACALVFACACLVLGCPWHNLGFASASSVFVFVFVGTRRATEMTSW